MKFQPQIHGLSFKSYALTYNKGVKIPPVISKKKLQIFCSLLLKFRGLV